MNNLLINKYTFAILAFIIGLGLGYCTRDSAHNPNGTSTVTKTERIDSIVYEPKPYPVYKTKTFTKLVPYYVDTTGPAELAWCNKKKYADSTQLDSGLVVYYNATVTGTLDSLSVKSKNTSRTKVIYRTTTLTKTDSIKLKPYKFFGGLFIQSNAIGPSVQYIQDRHSFGAQYNLIKSSPTTEKVRLTYHYGIR